MSCINWEKIKEEEPHIFIRAILEGLTPFGWRHDFKGDVVIDEWERKIINKESLILLQ